ncbi:MAG: hypothetical protein Q9193_006731 [Seirophora villosa]
MNPTVLAPIYISDYVHHKPLSTLAAGIATMLLILFSVLCAYAQVSVWELFLSGIRRYRHKFPVVPNDAGQDLRKPLMEGTKKYPNRPFEIPTVYKKTVILPRKFIEEVKAMPDSQLSFQRDVYERLVGQHTMIGSHEHSMIQSVKFDLTTNIARMQADLQDEAAFAVREQFGPCPGDRVDEDQLFS